MGRGWFSALGSIRHNPIPAFWLQAEQRRLVLKPWPKRSPGLFTLAVVLSLIVTALLVFLLVRALGYRAGGESVIRVNLAAYSGTALTLLAGQFFAYCWLLACWFTAAQTALGFLGTGLKRGIGRQLDDLLATSGLSVPEILIGAGLFNLRLVLPPLIMLALCAAGLRIAHTPLFAELAVGNLDAAAGWQFAGSLLLITALRIAGGGLACLLLTYLLISVGGGRSAIMPWIGAGGQVVMQLLLAGAGVQALVTLHSHRDVLETQPLWLDAFFIILAAYVFLVLSLARSHVTVRRAVAYVFWLFLGLLPLALFAYIALAQEYIGYFSGIRVGLFMMLQAFSLTGLPSLYAEVHQFWPRLNWFKDLCNPAVVLTILGLQLVLLIVCAGFAHDTILRRRAQGEGGGDA